MLTHGFQYYIIAFNGNTVKPVQEMTEREAFLELEKEREAFERFYQKNWKSAKKKIRKRILWGRK